MSTLLLVTGIIVAVSTLTYVYYKQQHQHQAQKPDLAEENCSSGLEFPNNYGKNQLNLLVRDPEWLYAYWEITATVQSEFSRQYGDVWTASSPILRVYDITNEYKKAFYDIHIQDYADSWYLHVGRPNHTFFVDLGRLLPDGNFYCIARSNLVTTPSNHISDIIDPNWVPIEALWDSLKAYDLESSLSSPELMESRCD